MKILLLIAILPSLALSTIPLKKGQHNLSGIIHICSQEKDMICLKTNPKSRSMRLIVLAKSKWDKSLKSILGTTVDIAGKWDGKYLTLQEAPKVHLPNIEE